MPCHPTFPVFNETHFSYLCSQDGLVQLYLCNKVKLEKTKYPSRGWNNIQHWASMKKSKIHTHTDMERSRRYNKFFESLEENKG